LFAKPVGQAVFEELAKIPRPSPSLMEENKITRKCFARGVRSNRIFVTKQKKLSDRAAPP
jgi:hypothetical protein